jgi:LysM repeat protein
VVIAPDGQGGQQPTPAVPGQPFTYVVVAGDNLYRISIRFNVSMSALMAANGLTPSTINLIYVGQQLNIPAPLPTTPTPVVITQAPVIIVTSAPAG